VGSVRYLEDDILHKSFLASSRKAVLWVGLLAFMAGCSGFRTAVIPGVDDTLDQGKDAPVLSEGMVAKVHLLTGETLKGEVVRFDTEVLTIGRVGNYGFEETDVLFSEIEMIEVESIAKGTEGVARAGGVVLMVLAGLLVLVMVGCAVGDCNFGGE
jgi:hypothetical protein